MAESILKHMVAEKGQENDWIIDSAATSDYEIGSTPDPRTNQTLRGKEIPESDHIARQVSQISDDHPSNIKTQAVYCWTLPYRLGTVC